MAPYQIFTDATADCSPQWLKSLPPVGIVPMRVEIGGQEYTYGPDGTITVEDFYALQKTGNYATTSQITPMQYFQSFEPVLRAGNDILYLCFSSGMSGTFQSAQVCAEELREEYRIGRSYVWIHDAPRWERDFWSARRPKGRQMVILWRSCPNGWPNTGWRSATGLQWMCLIICDGAGGCLPVPLFLVPPCRSNRSFM